MKKEADLEDDYFELASSPSLKRLYLKEKFKLLACKLFEFWKSSFDTKKFIGSSKLMFRQIGDNSPIQI